MFSISYCYAASNHCNIVPPFHIHISYLIFTQYAGMNVIVLLCGSYWFHDGVYPFNVELCFVSSLVLSLVSILPCYYSLVWQRLLLSNMQIKHCNIILYVPSFVSCWFSWFFFFIYLIIVP